MKALNDGGIVTFQRPFLSGPASNHTVPTRLPVGAPRFSAAAQACSGEHLGGSTNSISHVHLSMMYDMTPCWLTITYTMQFDSNSAFDGKSFGGTEADGERKRYMTVFDDWADMSTMPALLTPIASSRTNLASL